MWKRYYSIVLLPSTMIGAILRLVSCGVLTITLCGLIILVLAIVSNIARRNYPEFVAERCPAESQSIDGGSEIIDIHNLDSLELIDDRWLGPNASDYSDGPLFSPDSEMLLLRGIAQSGYYTYYGNNLWHLQNGCITDIRSSQFSINVTEYSQDSNSLLVQVYDNRQDCTNGPDLEFSLVFFGITLNNEELFGPYSFAEFIQTSEGERLSFIECRNSNGSRKLLDLSTGRIDNAAPQLFASARTVSPDNLYYVSAKKDGVFSLWRTDTNEHVWDFPPEENDKVVSEFRVHEFSLDSHWLMARGGNDYVVWNVITGKRIITSSGWRHAHFSPDSQLFAHEQTVWNLSTGNIRFEIDEGTFRGFSADGTFFAVIRDGLVEFRRSNDGELLYTLDAGRDVRELAFSPDGRFVALKSFERPNQISGGYLYQKSYSEIWGIPMN